MEKFDKNKYNLNFRQKALKEKKKAQFNTDLYYEEKKELDELLNKISMSKADFIRKSKTFLERGYLDMTIDTLYKINNLNDKVKILLNNNIDSEFYNSHLKKEIVWLIENEEKINQDFNNNINNLKFDIILNSKLDERYDLITDLKKATIEEFSKYLNFVPFESLKSEEKNSIEKKFDKFKSISDNYDLIEYFNSISRR